MQPTRKESKKRLNSEFERCSKSRKLESSVSGVTILRQISANDSKVTVIKAGPVPVKPVIRLAPPSLDAFVDEPKAPDADEDMDGISKNQEDQSKTQVSKSNHFRKNLTISLD